MIDNAVVLKETDNVQIEENLPVEDSPSRCLNCGTELTDRFCPHCGQSAATPSKLRMKNFGKSVIMSFGRLTPGFFNTAKELMLRPWAVIRDYIHGHHAPYSPPITMVIQIFLYATIIFAGIDTIFGTDLKPEESLFSYEGDNGILKMMDQSIVFLTLIVGIPLCMGVYLAYYRHGAKKYNFAEYLAAFVYLFAAINLWDIVFTLINAIPGINFDLTFLSFIIAVAYGVIILIKAFPQKNGWISFGLMIWCSVVLLLSIICLGVIMYLPIMIKEHM